jgi:predicted RNA-binding protein with PUA-like domain
MRYWLMKSEPEAFSIDDLASRPKQTELWDGVRNYQARNMMRDEMQVGDLAFFYHSNAKPSGIAGVMRIARTACPDPTQFDMASKYYDPTSNPEAPRWMTVEVTFVSKCPQLLALEQLKQDPALSGMQLLRKGNRLSVMPVTKEHWHHIMQLIEK